LEIVLVTDVLLVLTLPETVSPEFALNLDLLEITLMARSPNNPVSLMKN
tara:strand:- start:379 stop:525 length:147 start_codon:yes stop_codon:yes gene_type:complete